MSEVENKSRPWEVPPDESYWRALMMEGEYAGEGIVLAVPPVESEQMIQSVETNAPDAPTEPTGQQEQSNTASLWNTAIEYMHNRQCIELPVTGFNRGGLLVEWNGITGFIPASQICARLPHGDELRRSEALAARVGDVLALEVIECDPDKNRLILSEVGADHKSNADPALLTSICPGDICRGRVTNLCLFGAFVDLGGVEGLIHISELSWGRVSHPEEVLQGGQEVDVYVLSVDPDHGRIGLSLKRLQADPWAEVEKRYQVGQILDGTVTSVVNFGAFVRLEEGLEGLVHISKLHNGEEPARQVVQEGQVVQVRILNIDSVQHRIGLSL